MRRAYSVDSVRAAEHALMAELPEGELMRRAAFGLAAVISDFLGGAYGAQVLLVVGSGDNGGDALLAGAHLLRRGARVEAILLGDNAHVAAFVAAGGRLVDAASARRPHVVVDGIVGIGGRSGLRDDAVAAMALFKGVPVVAVDLPSGVNPDSGAVSGPHVQADLTVTFGVHKPCHFVEPAASACGVVELVDIGLSVAGVSLEALQPDDVRRLLPTPAPAAHKYERGVVAIDVGSSAYPGAAVLCVAGAATGLAGMVRYVGPAAEAVSAAHPQVVRAAGRAQAWVVGCGSGIGAAAALATAIADDVPVVADADALEFVRPADHRFAATDFVLTPHAGELARMLDVTREAVEADQLAAARLAARRFDAVVVLKGRRTLIAAPDGAVRVNLSGTPWLAVAGAGDVLAGLIGALLAAGLTPFDAASVGCWLHGAAASLASEGAPITPLALAAAVPDVIRTL